MNIAVSVDSTGDNLTHSCVVETKTKHLGNFFQMRRVDFQNVAFQSCFDN